jgi:MoxR-like ATPase
MTEHSDKTLAETFYSDYERLSKEIQKVIIGQDNVVKQVLISMFCNGHSLLVGVPGLAKTLLIQTIASAL